MVSKEAEQHIEAAIAETEAHTSGVLVVVLARRSDPYDRARVIYAGVVTLCLAVLTFLWVPAVPELWVFYSQPLVLALLWWASGFSPILRLIAPPSVVDDAVAGAARRLFIERGLTETRDRSGVLLLLSEAEHRAYILADKGIHERFGSEAWQACVNKLILEIKAGRTEQGILDAVQEIGGSLAKHFPPRHDDKDELSNQVVRV
jgi:putative membrane protein